MYHYLKFNAMAIRTLEQLKAWFNPKAEQVWDWMDSFWHKSEQIPVDSIENLTKLLDSKYNDADGKSLEAKTDRIDSDLAQHAAENAAEFSEVDGKLTALEQEDSRIREELAGKVPLDVVAHNENEYKYYTRELVSGFIQLEYPENAFGGVGAVVNRTHTGDSGWESLQLFMGVSGNVKFRRIINGEYQEPVDIWHSGNFDPAAKVDLRPGGGVVLNPTLWNYQEGLRINAAPHGWAGIFLGGEAGSVDSYTEQQWNLEKMPSGDFVINRGNSEAPNSGLRLVKDGELFWNGKPICHSGNTKRELGAAIYGSGAIMKQWPYEWIASVETSVGGTSPVTYRIRPSVSVDPVTLIAGIRDESSYPNEAHTSIRSYGWGSGPLTVYVSNTDNNRRGFTVRVLEA